MTFVKDHFDLDIGFESIQAEKAFHEATILAWRNDHGNFSARLNRIYKGSKMEYEWVIYDIDHESYFLIRSKKFDYEDWLSQVAFQEHVQSMCLEKRKKRRFW